MPRNVQIYPNIPNFYEVHRTPEEVRELEEKLPDLIIPVRFSTITRLLEEANSRSQEPKQEVGAARFNFKLVFQKLFRR